MFISNCRKKEIQNSEQIAFNGLKKIYKVTVNKYYWKVFL